MNRFKDISNLKFGKLTPIRIVGKTNTGNGGGALWLCKCDCGNEKTVRQSDLHSGHVTSCGCAKFERFSEYKNYSKRLIKTYHSMKERCLNKNNKAFKNYGGRGINICKEWTDDIFEFCKWAIANGYNDKLTLERIDVNSDYCPCNCTWILRKEQSKNRRNSNLITYNGQTKCLSEWARLINQERKLIYYYLQRGVSFEEFLKIKNIQLD